ncbi:MAG TPA: helix-turn-helix transcriptional regulator [Rubrobacteraceae bacterium]|nr:helix-turn-helix transcriptional regulator [Rubrobacteraceae bacterium]
MGDEEGYVMKGGAAGAKIVVIRERRLWTQARLAEEAGISPTTVSGIESGRISRPHFGTLRKLARVLGVEPEELLSTTAAGRGGVGSDLSLEWAMSSGEDEFERVVEDATLEGLSALLRELSEEHGRLTELYERARSSEQRRLIKGLIRQVAANSGSVDASITAHRDRAPEHRSPRDERAGAHEPSA